jgi:hypothetical protein
LNRRPEASIWTGDTNGFGVVYRAIQPSVERQVAVKIIFPRYANHLLYAAQSAYASGIAWEIIFLMRLSSYV